MASGYVSGGEYFSTQRSAHISLGTSEYPNGTASVSGAWRNYTGTSGGWGDGTIAVYLCDSSGGNSVKLGEFYMNGGSSSGPSQESHTVSASINVSGLKGKALYVKVTKVNGDINPSNVNGNGNLSVSVATAVDQVSLTVTSADTNKGTVSGGGNHTPGVAVNISATAKTGYKFNGWETTSGSGTFGNASSASTTFTSSVNSAVRAKFTEQSYTITVNGTANTWTYGSVHSLTASAKTGHTFSKWTATAGTLSSATSATTNYTVAASNATVTANYNVNNYTITVNGSANTWAYGSVHSISAPAKTGYTFSRWTATAGTLASATSSTTNYTVAASNATVTPTYNINSYAITITASAGGTVSSGGTWQYNSSHEITATANEGYRFAGWTCTKGTIANVSSASTTYTVSDGAATVTASFIEIDYNINMSSVPAVGGTCSASPSVANIGDVVTLSQTPAAGYVFEGWTTEPQIIISDNAFEMPAQDVSVSANYRKGECSCTISASSFVAGSTVRMTISTETPTFPCKYRINFGPGMDTGLVDVAAGVTQVDIYIPVSWSKMLVESTMTGGVLTLSSYYNGDAYWTYEIDNLEYSALDGTVPRLDLFRAKPNGSPLRDGTTAGYSIVVPDSASSYRLICMNSAVNNPSVSGTIMPNDKKHFPLNESVPVTLEITYGSETFGLTQSVPAVVLMTKGVD